MSGNNDSFKNALVKGMGETASEIKAAYENHQAKKAQGIIDAQKILSAKNASLMYRYIGIETSEIFNALAGGNKCVAETLPQNIRTVFDGENFVYKIPIGDGEEVHFRTIQSTVNKICLDRFQRGYSLPFLKPLEYHVENDEDDYRSFRVNVTGVTGEEGVIPIQAKSIGHSLGHLRYNAESHRLYIGSRNPKPINIGKNFQVLLGRWDAGEWLNVKLDWQGYLHTEYGISPAYKWVDKIIARII